MNFGRKGFTKDLARPLFRRRFRQNVHKNWKYSSGPRWYVECRHWTVDWSSEFVVALVLLQCYKRTLWLSGVLDSNSLTRCCGTCCWIVGLSWYDLIEASLLCPVTLLTLEFCRPAALRMVTDVARIQCDVKWVDRPAFLLMRPSKLSKVFFPKGTLQNHTASLSLNLPVL